MPDTNPYNATKPGHLFAGYEQTMQHMLQGLADGSSYAVIGGRRAGKTSFLMKLESEIINDAIPGKTAWVVKDSALALPGKIDREFLFKRLYSKLSEGWEAPDWQCDDSDEAYDCFLELTKNLAARFMEKSPNWLVVLILDELDAIKQKLGDDDAYFTNLRHLLMESPFKGQIRLVASGVRAMEALIGSGSSPLNNLISKPLSILSEGQARRLIRKGFADGIDSETEMLKVTGRHPYLMQAILQRCWSATNGNGANVNRALIQQSCQQYLREHDDFKRWVKHFTEYDHRVYYSLSQGPEDGLELSELRKQSNLGFGIGIDDIIKTFSYHGIVDDEIQDQPRIAGTLFRGWYLERFSTGG